MHTFEFSYEKARRNDKGEYDEACKKYEDRRRKNRNWLAEMRAKHAVARVNSNL